MHGVQGQHCADTADYAGSDDAGMRKFGVQAENTDEKKHEKDVWFNDARKKFLPRGKLEFLARVIGKRKLFRFAAKTSDVAAIEFMKQVVGIVADEVDEMAVQCFFFGE